MKATAASNSPYYLGATGDRTFKSLAHALQRSAANAHQLAGGRLFYVDPIGLYQEYLNCFDDSRERQFHNCHCCQRFIERFGNLVRITAEGGVHSVMWDEEFLRSSDIAHQYWRVVRRMETIVTRRPIEGQYLWRKTLWGTPEEGGFSHFHVHMPAGEVEATFSEGQAMAVRREDHKHLDRALIDMPADHVNRAVAMLEAGSLYRAETLLPMGKFIQNAQRSVHGLTGEFRYRRLWHAVGQAARGWCTPRDSAFGALVYDIADGKSPAVITLAHNARMDPTKYQRPQVAPAAGNIRQAEKVFEKLGLESALRRRPMALEEAELFWRPRRLGAPPQHTEGMFSHIDPKVSSSPTPPKGNLTTNPVLMTFAKFQRDILPHVLQIRLLAPYNGSYCAFTTAVEYHAQPLYKWDSLDRRNPGAWYLYQGGSTASGWRITPNSYVNVLGLAKLPPDWYGGSNMDYQTQGRVLLVLEGAEDTLNKWLSLFPESMRGELHEVRATIEAHSKSRPLEPEHRQRASGYLLGGDVHIEVTTQTGIAHYKIDRLE